MSEQHSAKTDSKALTPKSTKDVWDKIDILTKPIFASFTAAVIAIIGYFGQNTLTAISAQEQNARLYTELLSRREEAESALRKDMFGVIMKDFFNNSTVDNVAPATEPENIRSKQDPNSIENSLSKSILKLEMLALNFGDSLSLGPLFKEMSRDVELALEINKNTIIDWKKEASKHQKRLRSLAKRVASTQLTTIFPRGQNINLKEIPTRAVEIPDDGHPSKEWTYTLNDISGEDINNQIVELDGVRRIFEMRFRNADLLNKSVQVKLNIFEFVTKEIVDKYGRTETYEDLEKIADMEFTLDYFNFPLIDNSRLSHNHRVAVVIEDFDINTIKVTGVVFPGLYASQRDKPFLNEAIQELKDQQHKSERGTNQPLQLLEK